MQKGSIELAAVRNFDQVLAATFAFIRENFRPLLRILLIVAGPVLLFTALADEYLVSTLAAVTHAEDARDSFLPGYFGAPGYQLWIFVTFLIGTMFFDSAIYGYMILYREHGPGNFTAAAVYALVRRNLVRLFLLSLCIYAAVAAGLLFLIAGGVYVMVAVFISIPAAVFEEQDNSWLCLARTFSLTKGAWWRTCALLVTTAAIGIAFGMVGSLPYYAALFAAEISFGESAPGWMDALLTGLSVVSYLAASLSSSVVVIAAAFHYFSLAEETGFAQLQNRITTIGAGEQPGGRPEYY